MAKCSYVFFAVLLIFILAIGEIEAAGSKLCEKTSKTWSGKCDNKKCDKKCIEWEKAQHGACHKREAGKESCFCYFDCSKSPPGATPVPPGAAPPPAAGGSPPPPADGGSPPPPADGGSPPADGGSPPPPSAH